MKVGSMFAGIGGFDLGFERAGFEIAWCIEFDKHAQAVLRKRFPNAIIYSDIRDVNARELERVDVVCGGFPCQDLSMAGKRAGLSGERSGLFHDAMRLVRELNPHTIVIENVPGLLSSNHGRDFGTVLREMGEGWNCAEVAWRILDSQHFGVPQRRRRVFIVASSAIGRAGQILGFTEGGGGDYPTRAETRKENAADAAQRANYHCESVINQQQIPFSIQGNLIGREHGGPDGVGIRQDGTMYTLTANDVHAVAFQKPNGLQSGVSIGIDSEFNSEIEKIGTLKRGPQGGHINCVAYPFGLNEWQFEKSIGVDVYNGRETGQISATLTVSTGGVTGSGPKVMSYPIVRRLTPVECERLQGFPDGWTNVGTSEKPTPDTHRYRQLGNAVTVNVAEWIAKRILIAAKDGTNGD